MARERMGYGGIVLDAGCKVNICELACSCFPVLISQGVYFLSFSSCK